MKFEFPKLRIEDLPMPTDAEVRVPQPRNIHLERIEFDGDVYVPVFYRSGRAGHNGPTQLL